jgi:hypothetical protein
MTGRHILARQPTVMVEFLGDAMRALALQIE